MNRPSIDARLTRLETIADGNAPAGSLPYILPDDEHDSAEAADLLARGYRVTTFEQFVQEAV